MSLRADLSSAPPTVSAAIDPAPPSTEPPVTLAELYRQMWRFAAGARVRLVVSSLMLTASALVKLLAPWLTAQAIDTLQRAGDASALAACVPWVGAVVGVYALGWALHGPGRVLERSVALRVRQALNDGLYARLVDAPLAWHGTHHSAELAHRLSQAANALSNFTQSQFVYLQTAVNLVGPLIALFLLSRLTGGVALVGFVAVAATIVAFDRAMMRLAREENAAERRHQAALLDHLTHILTILSLRLQQPTRRRLAHRLDAVMAPLRRGIALGEWKWCAVDLLTLVLSWGLVALHAWHRASEHGGSALLLGSVFMVYQYAQQAGGVVGSLASNLQNFARMRSDFASAAPIWAAPQSPPPGAANALCSGGWQHIDLCALSCEGGDDADPRRGATLREITLRLHAGERLALVGPSGAGKSTLLRLMAGLIEPSHGHVEIDGVPRLGLHELRSGATLIAQEPQVFEATLRDNLAFDTADGASAIAAAARVALLDAVIDTLPLGLDTPIAQGGANLSGGQRQRLCLARGVLAARDSALLLLDEPTSALDPMTEAQVYDRLDAAFPLACLVASVHRLSLLPRFDRVALVVQGRIVDVGSVTELRARQPLFREMLATDAPTAAPLQVAATHAQPMAH